LAHELGESYPERLRRGRIYIAAGSDDEQTALAQLAGEELQEQQRRLIRRMQIVQDKDKRGRLCGVPEERRRSLEEPEAGRVRLEFGRFGQLAQELAQLRQQLGQIG